MKKTPLCEIMNAEKSDKGNGHHNYTLEYYRLFNEIKDKIKTVFEVGLGTNNLDVPSNMGIEATPGASLRGWRNFFLNATIYGADIDSRVLFTEPRINTFYVDQTDTITIHKMWNDDKLKDIDFDIIIDDGLHEVNANITFLKNSYLKLKSNGIYIIEDVVLSKLNNYIFELNNLRDQFNFNYDIKILGNPNNYYDNCLIVINPR